MTQLLEGGAGEVSQATPDAPATEPSSGTASLTLVHFDRARQALELASSIDEVKAIRDQAEALRQYARQSRQSLEMQNRCAEIKLRAERKAGEMLAASPKAVPSGSNQHQDVSRDLTHPPRLADIGISRDQSSRWQAVAQIPERTFEAHIAATKDAGEELTTASLMRAAERPHVAHNSGENEWYTPREFIDAARAVLGRIDLDPATSERANEVVQAEFIYTIEDDGLSKDWGGRVWMNPPYAAELIGRFTEKLKAEYLAEHVIAAICLVNNATETQWFQSLAAVASAICFPERRIRFWNPNGQPGAPLQGQAFLYIGTDPSAFIRVFAPLGIVAEVRCA